MKDYLRELCEIAGIDLFYNENRLVILSASVKNNRPTIRAHSIFSSSTREVAKAIVSYFTGIDSKEEELMIINNYAVSKLETSRIKVLPPDREFISCFNKRTEARIDEIMDREDMKSQSVEDENIKEANVKSIIQKDFYGNISSTKSGNKINTRDKDYIELDIIIDRYKA